MPALNTRIRLGEEATRLRTGNEAAAIVFQIEEGTEAEVAIVAEGHTPTMISA